MTITVNTNFDNGKTKGRGNDVWGSHRVSIFTITLDSSYPAGGEAWDPKQSGHQGEVAHVALFPRIDAATGATTAAGRVFYYDHTAKKIVGYQQKDPADAGGADIPLPEIADTTDLSGTKLVALVFSS